MDGIIRNTSIPKKFSLRELDFFSEGASVKIKSDDRVKSSFGACLSILIYGLLTAAVYYYLTKYLDETSPKLQNNKRLLPSPSNFTASQGGIAGTYLFFLVTNPSSKAGDTEPKYLTINTYKNYYAIRSTYTESKSKIDGQIVKPDTVGAKPVKQVKVVSCAEAEWFKAEENQEILKANSYTMFLIREFGMCPVFDESISVYGDEQTLDSGKYQFVLEACQDPICDTSVAQPIISQSSGQSVTIGAFQPVVNNAKKTNPFDYEISMDSVIPLNQFLNSKVVISLKELVVETDVGKFIEDLKEESKSAINNYRVSYDPVVTIGGVDITDPNLENFFVKFVTPSVPPITITLVSSRTSEQVSRSYDTIIDLIGNAGGTAEALIMILLILFHWIENMHVESRINSVVGKYLGLPEPMRPPLNMLNPWIKPFVKEKTKKTQLQSDDVVAEIVEKALSVEQMSYNQIMLRFFLEHSLPSEVSDLIPVVYVMKELLFKHMEEEQEKLAEKKELSEKKGNADESENKIILRPVESDLGYNSPTDGKPKPIELQALQDRSLLMQNAIQSPEQNVAGKNQQYKEGELPANDGLSQPRDYSNTGGELKPKEGSDSPARLIGVINDGKTELPQPEVLSPGGIDFRQLFGGLSKEDPEANEQRNSTPEKESEFHLPEIPEEPREGSLTRPVSLKDPMKRALIASPASKETKKNAWVPFFQHLQAQGVLDGNERDLAHIQELSKQKPALLKSYQVLQGNLTVQDEHQDMRKNLYGIIQEFMAVKHFSVQDIFGKEEDQEMRESWVRPLKSTSDLRGKAQ